MTVWRMDVDMKKAQYVMRCRITKFDFIQLAKKAIFIINFSSSVYIKWKVNTALNEKCHYEMKWSFYNKNGNII